jgi:hypothetical protein
MKEAMKLLQLSEMKGLPYNPSNDGFAFRPPKFTPPSAKNAVSIAQT